MMKFSSTKHLAKATHNQQFFVDVETLGSNYADWQVTANFYAAVHMLQAYFKKKTSHYPESHSERDELIARDPNLKGVYSDYRELKTLSVNSRYGCFPVNKHDVEESTNLLNVIRTHIDTLL